MTPSNARLSPKSGARRKAVLYCPECGHESTVDGDWCVERTAKARTDARERIDTGRERVAYACPNCGYVITRRPVHGLASA